MLSFLLISQTIALLVLIGRLLPGRNRRPPVLPMEDRGPPRVSVLVPTLNEVERLEPCVEGLMQQGPTVQEILVVDGNSRDGTADLVQKLGAEDARVRLTYEPQLPNGWIGKVWALQHGLQQTSGEWVLNVDADIDPEPGMVAAALRAAEELRLEVVSFSPCFAGQTAAEQWLQSAILVTLVYRSGIAGADGRAAPERVLANGQCFLVRRDVLMEHGGYAAARSSFSDDVTLARHLARRGARVGFLDGSRLYRVRSYSSLGEMWREWGRSIALKDASSTGRLIADVLLLLLAQALPLPLLVLSAATGWPHAAFGWAVTTNAALVLLRCAMLVALASAYDKRHWTYWFSALADGIAVARIVLSALRRPTSWRGRRY